MTVWSLNLGVSNKIEEFGGKRASLRTNSTKSKVKQF